MCSTFNPKTMYFSLLFLLIISLTELLTSSATEPNQQFNITCPDSNKCGCFGFNYSYRIFCPLEEDHIYQVNIRYPDSIEITCNSLSPARRQPMNYDLLTGLKVGSVRLISFSYCWLPHNRSLAELSQTIGVNATEALTFTLSDHLNEPFEKKYLAGFEHLEKLNLFRSRLENISQDFLQGFTNLKHLNLGENLIDHLDKNFLNSTSKLEHLTLAHNLLTRLEDEFFANLTNLKILNLSWNKLLNISNSTFSNLFNLEELDLNRNNLQILPAEVFQDLTKLRTINIGRNNFSAFPEALLPLASNLEYLQLWNNLQGFSLPDSFFSNFTKLKEIIIADNEITSISESFFWNCTSLIAIRLSQNKLRSLPKNLFRDQIHLERLNLESNELDSIPDNFFKRLIQLESLNLDQNHLQNFSRYTFEGLTKLKDLKLRKNRLTHLDSESFKPLQQLVFADLSYNQLSLPFKENIAEDSSTGNTKVVDNLSPFQYCINLRDLYLAYNKIENIFKDWRLHLPKLQFLDLTGNLIQRLNAEDLYFVSERVSLRLSKNRISVFNFSNAEALSTGVPPREVKGKIDLSVDSNPINCDCESSDFISYLNEKPWPSSVNFSLKIRSDDLKCEKPDSLRGLRARTIGYHLSGCNNA